VGAVTDLVGSLAPRPLLAAHVEFKGVLIGLSIALVAWLALVPLAFLLWQSFLTPQTANAPTHFTLQNFRDAYFNAETASLFLNSVRFATGAAGLALFLGTALAWLNERTNTPFKSLFFALTIIPLVIPGILFTVSWIMLASPKIGLINLALQKLLDTETVFLDIYSMPGMIWVDGLHYSPMAFLLMTAAFRSMDPSLEEQAAMSGASLLQTARRITLKLAWPAALGSLLILFARSVESFEVPALLGLPVGIHVYTSSIYQAIHQYPSQVGLASAYAVTLLLLISIAVYSQSRFAQEESRYSTVTGKGFRPRTIDLGRWRYLTAGIFILYFLVIVLLPFLVLVWSSLQRFYSAPSWAALSRMSLDSYRAVLSYSQFGQTVWNSFVLALGSATAVMLDRRAHQAARAVAAGQHRVDAAGLPRVGAWARHHGLLPVHGYRHLRNALDHVHCVSHAFPAVRNALQLRGHVADPQGTRGIGSDERRLLEHELSAHCAPAAQTRLGSGFHLCDGRFHPRALKLDPAVLARHRSRIDHDMGTVAEWSVRGAFRARGHADPRAVLPGHAGATVCTAVRNCGSLMRDRRADGTRPVH
jgi:ABC-type spermidine/putrescine transport system permease subunit II